MARPTRFSKETIEDFWMPIQSAGYSSCTGKLSRQLRLEPLDKYEADTHAICLNCGRWEGMKKSARISNVREVQELYLDAITEEEFSSSYMHEMEGRLVWNSSISVFGHGK